MTFKKCICERCGGVFAADRRAVAKYCPGCRPVVRKLRYREYQSAHYKPKERVCALCGQSFVARTRGRVKHCPECRIQIGQDMLEERKSPASDRPAKKKQTGGDKYKNFDAHVAALAKAGVSYAEEQKRKSIEKYARVDITGGGGAE